MIKHPVWWCNRLIPKCSSQYWYKRESTEWIKYPLEHLQGLHAARASLPRWYWLLLLTNVSSTCNTKMSREFNKLTILAKTTIQVHEIWHGGSRSEWAWHKRIMGYKRNTPRCRKAFCLYLKKAHCCRAWKLSDVNIQKGKYNQII